MDGFLHSNEVLATAVTVHRAIVILIAAKDLARGSLPREILRCAQDDGRFTGL